MSTWVLTPEYLIALALALHRSKDYERVSRLLSESKVDRGLIGQLIEQYDLREFWQVFLRRYPEFDGSGPDKI
jgi:hypothetical protein